MRSISCVTNSLFTSCKYLLTSGASSYTGTEPPLFVAVYYQRSFVALPKDCLIVDFSTNCHLTYTGSLRLCTTARYGLFMESSLLNIPHVFVDFYCSFSLANVFILPFLCIYRVLYASISAVNVIPDFISIRVGCGTKAEPCFPWWRAEYRLLLVTTTTIYAV